MTNDSGEIKAVFKSYQDCLNHGSTAEALPLYDPNVSSCFQTHPDEFQAASNCHICSLE